MSLFSRITCHPPLGQVTCHQRDQRVLSSGKDDTARFTVVIESSHSLPEQPWEAQIWHNITSPEWSAVPLQQSSGVPLVNKTESEYKFHRHVFSGDILLPSHGGCAQFTVRYRVSQDHDWQWVNQQQNTKDGELVFAAKEPEQENVKLAQLSLASAEEGFSKYFDGLGPDLKVESRRSEAPGSTLWHISGKVGPAQDGRSGLTNVTLGVPSRTIFYFALVRVWTPWLGPRHGRGKFRITEDAILCSFLREDGEHVVLLAVSGINNVLTVFGSGDNGEVVIKSQNDNNTASGLQILVSTAADFEVATSAVIYEARKLVRPYDAETTDRIPTPVSPPGDDVVLVEKDPEAQWLSEWYDGLTYCTWNGLGQDLTEEKIFNALDTLRSHGINISNLIIDDNWQALDNEGDSQFKRRWKQFEANLDAFPRGLKKAVEAIRRKHPNIQHIGVWHALLGYWGGISPDGDIANKFKTKEVQIKDPAAGGPIAKAFEKQSLLAIHPDDVQRFYDEFYSYLASTGVDAVKTDAQFFLDLLKDPGDRRSFTRAYQDAWSISSLRYFGTKAISCMSMFPQAIFNSQLPTNKPTIPLRNSDDFFPEVPASHTWHVFCNAHNALLTRYLNVLPDWDMFQTSHPYASFHAAARCVSGGPIYITDEPGNHNISVINEITAPTTQGTTVILRPSLVGRTIDMYHDYSAGHVLRVGTYTGWARTGSGILGLFNVSDHRRTTLVSLQEFPGIHDDYDAKYIVRSHTSGIITDLMRPFDRNALVGAVLEDKGWEILTAYPTQAFNLKCKKPSDTSERNPTHAAVLGLLGKMTGAAAIVSSDIYVEANGRLRFDISLKALGTLGVYISDLPDWSIEEDLMVTILGYPVPRKTVWKEGNDKKTQILAVDILTAWREMKLKPGWSNEVIVQVFLG
ncbi:raffinose synthase protein Sip1 [Aspergillus nomiae NRRL 13137]|uniref:Raffinose synthase protein Sip1 n=1 Tax=Aspergillus nomiae NRRL (strain ATCC 15546 / NRRL 13137 / CBS 260.88 / M93) TaxID=1509407 RepID=A0A0L1JG95_ASPN3|nr:raffinose synthase protein Sip1 [Aspergillus nomiae NRRL 13137]KNG90789.1 raffinose synthase protein Sip1 [Aspergillus nomiae NRRL 13137]